jgi:hypothetical protein
MPKYEPAAVQNPVPRYFLATPSGRPSISRERVRQIEIIAMRKFEREMFKRGIFKADLLP